MTLRGITVIEEMIREGLGSFEPSLSPVFVGPVYDIVDDEISPSIVLFSYSYTYDGGSSSGDAISEPELFDDIEAILSLHPDADIQISMTAKYNPGVEINSTAEIQVDNLRTIVYHRPDDEERYTISGDHLHDEATDFYSIGVEAGDAVVLADGRKFWIKNVAFHDLYFQNSTTDIGDVDLPGNFYDIVRYEHNKSLPYVENEDGDMVFGVDVSPYALQEAVFKFFMKSVVEDAIWINKYESGSISTDYRNPIGYFCENFVSGECYYVPLPDNTLKSYQIASEIVHDSDLFYTVVPMSDSPDVISLFIPRFNDRGGQEIKIVLMRTDLITQSDITQGTGQVI
ncbi:MAG: hypothetical protein SVK08_01635 [Halobacteriota archaeon]|nr:hypothetical protein [Halobacteriota archaeon]